MLTRLWERLTARYPLRRKATWATLIALAGTWATQAGVENIADIEPALQNILNGLWVLLTLLGWVRSSEAAVTPVADPRDNAGHQLTADNPDRPSGI